MPIPKLRKPALIQTERPEKGDPVCVAILHPSTKMYAGKTVIELRSMCKEKGIRGFSGKPRAALIAMLTATTGPGPTPTPTPTPTSTSISVATSSSHSDVVRRLNYIGSKYQLLDWLCSTIQTATGWSSLSGRRIADLFAGTGIVSYHLRRVGAAVYTNDAEHYAAVIARAFTCSVASEKLLGLLAMLQAEIDANAHASTSGVISTIYAPNPITGCERQFFTADNARRIDYLRTRIESLQPELTDDEHAFLLASLILAADAVSNVPAVYGCYLKKFKPRAQRALSLEPIHHLTTPAAPASGAANANILTLSCPELDAIYLDPPYNSRHYSKNYFPLNAIAAPPSAGTPAVHGKTGIPDDCFISPFSGSPAAARAAFETMFASLKAPWIFLSYSNEGTLTRAELEAIMGKYGSVTVAEREYQRFKSFEYNESGTTKEYLFCLHRSVE